MIVINIINYTFCEFKSTNPHILLYKICRSQTCHDNMVWHIPITCTFLLLHWHIQASAPIVCLHTINAPYHYQSYYMYLYNLCYCESYTIVYITLCVINSYRKMDNIVITDCYYINIKEWLCGCQWDIYVIDNG